jgi:hypothetical protein
MAVRAALAIVADRRDLDPTEPDANGNRWARCEDGGRRIWWCGCGASAGWIPRADLLDSLRKHAGCPVADDWPDKTKEKLRMVADE